MLVYAMHMCRLILPQIEYIEQMYLPTYHPVLLFFFSHIECGIENRFAKYLQYLTSEFPEWM